MPRRTSRRVTKHVKTLLSHDTSHNQHKKDRGSSSKLSSINMAPDNYDETPRILSMEVDIDDENDSEYRVQAGPLVKYITIAPGTLQRDLLSFPLASLPRLPYKDPSWNSARIHRDRKSGEIRTELSSKILAAVTNIWHAATHDVTILQRTKRLSAAAFETILLAMTPVTAIEGSAPHTGPTGKLGSSRKDRKVRMGDSKHRAGDQSLPALAPKPRVWYCSSVSWTCSRRNSCDGIRP